jgi:hypothetical protein
MHMKCKCKNACLTLGCYRGLDPGKSPTRMTRGRAGRPLLTHLLTGKAFNTTTSTYVATTPPAWEQYQCLILLFTAHPGMDGQKPPLYTRQALFYLRRPLEAQHDNYRVPGSQELGIICFSSTPSTMSRPGLEHRRSIKEQRPYDDNRESHAHHRTQGLSPSCHRRHRDTPRDGRRSQGHVATATSTVPIAPSPPRHHPRVLVHLGLHLNL